MQEHVIQLSDHLKGLSDAERTILWQALTIDILGAMQADERDIVRLVVGRDRERDMLRADVSINESPAFMLFLGEYVPNP